MNLISEIIGDSTGISITLMLTLLGGVGWLVKITTDIQSSMKQLKRESWTKSHQAGFLLELKDRNPTLNIPRVSGSIDEDKGD